MLVGVILVLAGFRQIKIRAEKKLMCLETILEEVKRLQFLLLSDPCQAFSVKIGRRDDISLVLNSVESMYFEGSAPLASIQAIAQILLNVRVWLSKSLQIECLIIGRFLLVICVASLIRFALGFPFSFSYMEIKSLIFELDMVLGGSLVCILVHVYFSWFYPEHWFWDLDFTETGKYWLAAKFNREIKSDNNFAKKWQILTRKEQLLGINLEEEKKQLLNLWSIELDFELQIKKQKFDDSLPLFEFFSYSFYVIILLYSPLKEYFEFSLDMSF